MKNLKVILTVGGIASGKSTWAKQYVKDNPSWIRVNRDDIREMVKSSPVLNSKGEDYVTAIQTEMIDNALMMNYNVILDNTNLKVEYIEDICEQVKYKADVEFKLFPIELDEALARNSARDRIVPHDVIRRMNDQYNRLLRDSLEVFIKRYKQTQIFENPIDRNPKYEAIVVDLDGSLCHMNGKRGPFDFEQVYLDDCDNVLKEHINFHAKMGRRIIIVSGRDDSCYELTEDWLIKHNIPYHFLYMRNTEDKRKDCFVKEDIYNAHIKGNYEVIVWYDDRCQVINHIRKLGVRVYQVNDGKF